MEMRESAPWELRNTLRVSHFPTGPATINYHSESGTNSGREVNELVLGFCQSLAVHKSLKEARSRGMYETRVL